MFTKGTACLLVSWDTSENTKGHVAERSRGALWAFNLLGLFYGKKKKK